MSSFVLEVPLRNLRPGVIYSVPCDRIVQRAYWRTNHVGIQLLVSKLQKGHNWIPVIGHPCARAN